MIFPSCPSSDVFSLPHLIQLTLQSDSEINFLKQLQHTKATAGSESSQLQDMPLLQQFLSPVSMVAQAGKQLGGREGLLAHTSF